MNFVGTGKRLAPGDVGRAARSVGVETAVLLAFIEVETAGRGFDRLNRPKMLRETHKFYAELPASKRDAALRAGVATRTWVRNYKPDSYPDLQKMIIIDKNAALRACSWGLSQILGSNHLGAGFSSAEEMVLDAMRGEYEQLMQMVSLMKNWGMIKHLTGRDFSKADSWRDAARRWNGSSYATHNYHGRMATAYIKHRSGEPMVSPEINTPRILKKGMKGEDVRALQSDLALLGYKFESGVDGRFGDETLAHVRSFQRSKGLSPDGLVGKDTFAAVAAAVSKIDKEPLPKKHVWTEDPKPDVTLSPPAAAPSQKSGGVLALIFKILSSLFKRS